MDKNTLANYGWVICTIIVIAILISLATPFGSVIRNKVVNTVEDFKDKADDALETTGDVVDSGDLGGGGSGEGGPSGGVPGEDDSTQTYTFEDWCALRNYLKNEDRVNAGGSPLAEDDLPHPGCGLQAIDYNKDNVVDWSDARDLLQWLSENQGDDEPAVKEYTFTDWCALRNYLKNEENVSVNGAPLAENELPHPGCGLQAIDFDEDGDVDWIDARELLRWLGENTSDEPPVDEYTEADWYALHNYLKNQDHIDAYGTPLEANELPHPDYGMRAIDFDKNGVVDWADLQGLMEWLYDDVSAAEYTEDDWYALHNYLKNEEHVDAYGTDLAEEDLPHPGYGVRAIDYDGDGDVDWVDAEELLRALTQNA